MKLSKHSKSLFYNSLNYYTVSIDHAMQMHNYLIFGFKPGSFMTSLLANDALNMIQTSHPLNSFQDLKYLTCWLYDHGRAHFYGSYEIVNFWLKKDTQERRLILESLNLIHPESQEIVEVLKQTPISDPYNLDYDS